MNPQLSRKEEIEKGCGKQFTIKGFDIIRFGTEITNIVPMPKYGDCDSKGLCNECKARLNERIRAEQDFLKMITMTDGLSSQMKVKLKSTIKQEKTE
jgi:hypothetical protein